MGNIVKLYSFCLFRGIFNSSLERDHYDTNSTDRDKMIKACDALVVCKHNLNIAYTAKMHFITPSWFVQVLHVSSSTLHYCSSHFATFEG